MHVHSFKRMSNRRVVPPPMDIYYGLKGWISFKFMTQHSWYASKIFNYLVIEYQVHNDLIDWQNNKEDLLCKPRMCSHRNGTPTPSPRTLYREGGRGWRMWAVGQNQGCPGTSPSHCKPQAWSSLHHQYCYCMAFLKSSFFAEETIGLSVGKSEIQSPCLLRSLVYSSC